MSSVIMLSIVLATPPSESATVPESSEEVSATVDDTKPKTPPDWDVVQKDYLSAMRKSARRAKPKLPEVVPALVEVYGDLEAVEGISHQERSRMRGVVKVRLEEFRNKLIRELLRNQKLANRKNRGSERVRTSEPVDEKAELLAGGGPNAQAIQLIELIQNTIEPESWQRAGGNGSISYFDLLKVLVIRQTGEVHHQLGGALEQLRR